MRSIVRPSVVTPARRGAAPCLGLPFRRRPWPRLWPCALAATLLFTGCPRRFDPRADEIHSQNPEAEAEYQRAQRLLQKGDLVAADELLKQFLSKYASPPADPLVPVVTLVAAQVARSLGQPARAKELAVPLAHPSPSTAAPSPWISDRARLELGLAEHRLGDFAEARALLVPLSAQIVPSDEATELHATLADLWLREDQPTEALHELDLFYHGAGVRPIEQAYVRDQVTRLLGKMPPDQQNKLRQRFAIETTTGTAPVQDPGATRLDTSVVVGLTVPLMGKDRALGERVLRGALWAAESLGGVHLPGTLAGVDLRVRDTASADAATLIGDLKRDGVQVLIGSPARNPETAELLAQAEKEGLLTLSMSAGGATATKGAPAPARRLTFQLLRSNVSRAQALARHLTASGLPSVAVLAPATAYGQHMTAAFLEALADKSRQPPSAAPIQVVEQLTFADNATTFTAQAKKLLAAAPAALYVPASATQLELIAAQLASSGVLPIYKVTRGTADNPGLASPPVKLLLSSAEGMGERLLKNAGRYLQGAVLAPLSPGRVAVADNAAAATTARWEGYSEQVGAEPGALDALGYDAILTLRTACARLRTQQGAAARCSGETLAGALRGLALQGATGPIAFDDAGERSGPVLLLRVDGTTLRSAGEPTHASVRNRPARL